MNEQKKKTEDGFWNVHASIDGSKTFKEWYSKHKREADYQDITAIILVNTKLWIKTKSDNRIEDWEDFNRIGKTLRMS